MARNHFWNYLALPTPDPLPPTFEAIWQGRGIQLHRPSLFYFLGALVVAPLLGAPIEYQLLAVRDMSAVFGALTVLVAYAAGRAASRSDPFIGLLAAAFVAALPMNVFVGAIANVDALAALLGGVLALGLARGVASSFQRRDWLLVLGGLALGLATKREFVGFLPGIALAGLLWAVRRGFLRWLLVAAMVGLASIAALAVFTSVFTRLATVASDYALNEPDQLVRMLQPPLSRAELLALVDHQWTYFVLSFWGMFGWFTTPLSPEVSSVLNGASVVCGVGLVVALSTARRPERGARFWQVGIYVALIVTMTLLAFGIALSYFASTEIPQGRQIFGVLVPLCVLFAVGARTWLPASRLGTWLPSLVLIALLVVLDIAAYRQSFAPFFLERSFP